MALLHFLRWPNEPEAKYNSHFCVGVLRRTFGAAPGQENSYFRVGVLRRTFEDTRGWADFVEGAHWSSGGQQSAGIRIGKSLFFVKLSLNLEAALTACDWLH